jgi:phage FluMu protein gp41
MFSTEIEFVLPKGYLDGDGTLHREGMMRLATAADEIVPLKDPRVKNNPAYLSIILLARVVTKLGGVEQITPNTIENLFSEDMQSLQNLYNEINHVQSSGSKEPINCPECNHAFEVEHASMGEAF